MGKLSDLYKARETFKGLGLELSEEQEAQLRSLEEDIIKRDILPLLTEKIEPALQQVQRELVLVVDYIPGAPLKVSLSRKRNLLDAIEDVVEIKPDPAAEHRTLGPQRAVKKNIADKTLLRVTFDDGTVIEKRKAKDTFIDAIMKIGINRVRPLGVKFCKIPIISNTRDPKYGKAQFDVGGGWLILTHSSTRDKKKMLDKIATSLGLRLKVEIIGLVKS